MIKIFLKIRLLINNVSLKISDLYKNGVDEETYWYFVGILFGFLSFMLISSFFD